MNEVLMRKRGLALCLLVLVVLSSLSVLSGGGISTAHASGDICLQNCLHVQALTARTPTPPASSTKTSPSPLVSCSSNCSGWGDVQWDVFNENNDALHGSSGCGQYSSMPRTWFDYDNTEWQINVRCDGFNRGSNDLAEAGLIYDSSQCGSGLWVYFDQGWNPNGFSLRCVTRINPPPSGDSLEFFIQQDSYGNPNGRWDVFIDDQTTHTYWCNGPRAPSCQIINGLWGENWTTENSVREFVTNWTANDYLSASLWRSYYINHYQQRFLETAYYPAPVQVQGANPPTAGFVPNTNTEYTCAYVGGCNYNSNALTQH